MDVSYVLLTPRRYDLRVNAVVSCRFPLAGLWRSLIAGRLLSLPGLGNDVCMKKFYIPETNDILNIPKTISQWFPV
ncbi:hypothetical protein [Nostoc sp. CHAB 5715]|uniref:hypothetical protein n=1 Tax=Nostoc sp. CHAB 5715 TaxID=2780400 RepID=UPI001E53B4A1|nr:hypothetical protein [Nostoc sp. CHAB 5715]MCC5620672.1 hypothetical protein [Nostoc sp. CHAB 5715]